MGYTGVLHCINPPYKTTIALKCSGALRLLDLADFLIVSGILFS